MQSSWLKKRFTTKGDAQQFAFQLLKNPEKFISKMRMERTLQMQILDIFIEILAVYEVFLCVIILFIFLFIFLYKQ